MRRLITLTFAGRDRMVVIRRELPLTRSVSLGLVSLVASNQRGFSFAVHRPETPFLARLIQEEFVTLLQTVKALLRRGLVSSS